MKEINYSKYYWQNDMVRLRPSTLDDWNDFYYNYFDNETRFSFNSEIELPLTEEGAKKHWQTFIDDANYTKFAIETIDGVSIGGMNLFGIDERNGTFGISIQIDRIYRGKGYGIAAMKILLDYTFNERRLHKYQTGLIEGNIASETLLKKLGCVKEGVIRGSIFHQGRYWDEIQYGLFAEEFNALSKTVK